MSHQINSAGYQSASTAIGIVKLICVIALMAAVLGVGLSVQEFGKNSQSVFAAIVFVGSLLIVILAGYFFVQLSAVQASIDSVLLADESRQTRRQMKEILERILVAQQASPDIAAGEKGVSGPTDFKLRRVPVDESIREGSRPRVKPSARTDDGQRKASPKSAPKTDQKGDEGGVWDRFDVLSQVALRNVRPIGDAM